MKKCSKCGKEKSISEFWKHPETKSGFGSNCKECHREICRNWIRKNIEKYRKDSREYAKKWRKKNKEKLKEYRKELYSKHHEKWSENNKRKYVERRKLVIEKYGNKCNCCGEKNIYFLTIDHINNDGFIHRKKYQGNMFDWARKNNYPKSLRVLCLNCNGARQYHGGIEKICPHKFTKDFIASRIDKKID